MLPAQKAFIDNYRASGKIILDTGNVPFFATARLSKFIQIQLALKASGNLGAGDLPIAADAITNNLQIITHDVRFIDGLDKALRGSKLRGLLKAYDAPNDIGRIFISSQRSAL